MYSPQIQKPRVLSVSQINFYIKSIIENDGSLQFVLVTGEISNLTVHQRSGHIYLSLKDSNSVISAVMFAGNARRLKFRLENGMKVICRGRISVYEPSGRYQLYIEDMQPDGVGALAEQGTGQLVGPVVELVDGLGDALFGGLAQVAAVVQHPGNGGQRDAGPLSHLGEPWLAVACGHNPPWLWARRCAQDREHRGVRERT